MKDFYLILTIEGEDISQRLTKQQVLEEASRLDCATSIIQICLSDGIVNDVTSDFALEFGRSNDLLDVTIPEMFKDCLADWIEIDEQAAKEEQDHRRFERANAGAY